MLKKEMWVTYDGEVFETHDKAEKHELLVIKKWLDNTAVYPNRVIATMDDQNPEEYYITFKDMAELVFEELVRKDFTGE